MFILLVTLVRVEGVSRECNNSLYRSLGSLYALFHYYLFDAVDNGFLSSLLERMVWFIVKL
jgi:hypothetical protein